MDRNTTIGICLIALSCCLMTAILHFRSDSGKADFSKTEMALINEADSIMRILTIEDKADSIVLRAESSDLSHKALLSEDYARLARMMVATVTHPSQDGVGIAGPQVGLNRRVVAVQRFDKGTITEDGVEVHPFEVYPNIRIVWASDSLHTGPEGCLSVPGRRAEVQRSEKIVIEYADMGSIDGSSTEIPMIRDTVSGFTAIIFQHEIDHLEGVLYIDRL